MAIGRLVDRSVLAPALVVVGVAVFVAVAFHPWVVNYDTRFALTWANDLVHGHTPEFQATYAPTPHPLWNALATIALVFGDRADDAMAFVVFLSFGALVWCVYAIGAELFGRWAGIVAGLVVLTRAAMLRDVVLIYLDVTFAALIALAVLLEVRRPRRGLAVLLTLLAAGLLRPEAWGLALFYVAYLWRGLEPRDRARYVALALAAPLVWFAGDLLITGDPLHSLHGTADLAEENERRRSLQDVPYWTVQYFGFILRLPLLIGIPVGLYVAFRRGLTRAAVPLVVAGLLVLAFTALPLVGLPLIGRYLRTPAALLTVFYGAACLAWLSLPRGRERTVLALVGAASIAASLVYAPSSVDQLRSLHWRMERQSVFFSSLEDLATSRRMQRAFAACPSVTAADHRPVPHLRWWLDGAPGTVGTVEGGSAPPGKIHVMPRPTRVPRKYYKSDYPRGKAPAGYRRIFINRAWRVFVSPECAPPRRRAR